ncbi:hypothetical protein K504DRAFT_539180 [Pleomassaria siparia CBS 279.74]|uniref:Uncharacterized protein n=1 Tax=Pleomassaria siparia CBS 279.74 TaxID=1314801 RepID=A0A6G1JRU5_9PLEO|nr:hypothetical protein K504DRAFT_539180 [Pleomassaria siparia CBS 279.74]
MIRRRPLRASIKSRGSFVPTWVLRVAIPLFLCPRRAAVLRAWAKSLPPLDTLMALT